MHNALTKISARFGDSFDVIEPHLQTALASAADPERSLVYLERLLDYSDDAIQQALIHNPRVVESLITIFSGSEFLTEIVLRNPKNVSLLHNRHTLTHRKNAEQVHDEAVKVIDSARAGRPSGPGELAARTGIRENRQTNPYSMRFVCISGVSCCASA